jgi:hypothetical protein
MRIYVTIIITLFRNFNYKHMWSSIPSVLIHIQLNSIRSIKFEIEATILWLKQIIRNTILKFNAIKYTQDPP